MRTVLLVEDCPDAGAAVGRALGPGFQMTQASDLAEAEALLDRRDFDVVLLDLSLPDGDGLRLCSRLQADPATADVPILFLSGTRDVRTKVMALTLGADDYVEKPFEPAELRARVEARLRKRDAARERGQTLHRGVLTIDVPRQAVTIAGEAGPRPVELTSIEYRLLYHLAMEPGRVLSRERLMSLAWGDTVVAQRTVDSHVSNLRAKLGPVAGACIATVRGAGYRLTPR